MVPEEQIKKLAYSIWEQGGRPRGKHLEHYYRARQILEHQEEAHIIELGPPRHILELPASPPTIQLAPPPPRRGSFSRRKKG